VSREVQPKIRVAAILLGSRVFFCEGQKPDGVASLRQLRWHDRHTKLHFTAHGTGVFPGRLQGEPNVVHTQTQREKRGHRDVELAHEVIGRKAIVIFHLHLQLPHVSSSDVPKIHEELTPPANSRNQRVLMGYIHATNTIRGRTQG
jgi:hypothetical protein